MQWLDRTGAQRRGGLEPWRDLLDAHDAHPKKSLEAVASSQVLINSPAPRPAEKCLPSARLPLLASWIADPVAFRAAKRPNAARKTFDEVSPDLSLEWHRSHHAWAFQYLAHRSDQFAAMAFNVLS